VRLTLTIAVLLIIWASIAVAAEPCQQIHGRMILYTADGQLRLWHIGTHHEFEPDYDGRDNGSSWDKAVDLLKSGNEDAGAAGDNALFADFLVCPTKPLQKGAVQPAVIRRVVHSHVVPRDQDGEDR
jgi:hypothetical protein